MSNKMSLFDGVLENSMNVGLQSNLKKSIENAGIRVPENAGLWQYPEIIRKNLVSKTVTGINILGGDIINIDVSSDNDVVTYNLSTIFDTADIERPNYSNTNNKWGKSLTVKDVFDDLFSNILPLVRGVYAGDVTSTDKSGNDINEWNHELYNKTGSKSGLESESKYIRLYLTCQAEPIYINIGSAFENISNTYNVKNTDTVSLTLDKDNNISAHINVINSKQLHELGI